MATDSTADEHGTYEQFIDLVKRHANLQSAGGVLNWDQEVMMPDDGTPARSQQLSAISSVSHDLLTSGEMAGYLDDLAEADLDPDQQAVVREVQRQHERADAVPRDLVEEITETTAEAHPVWTEAKENDDFDTFAPTLETLIDLKREQAEHIDPDRDPYAVMFEEFEPYLGLDAAERVLERLREELVPLIEDLREADADLADPFDGTYDTDVQEDLARDTLDTLGYDWDRGRLDVAPHPFSSGNQFDARVTTRFDEDDPLGAITSTIHEFGHAFYTLGLPDDHYGTPLGSAQGLTVHESQSRLWENHVGRTEAFWERFLPTMTDRFDQLAGTTTREAYEAANQIYPDNMIRVEADELTYHMHIILRFEIERDLVAGDLDVEEVPAVWNDKMEEYLGVRPETDAEGCLQDIHWSHGTFGYFPTYSLGSVLAAQLNHAMREDLAQDVDGLVRDGQFDPIAGWLRENVHGHGQRYTTDDLIEEATGEPFTADYFVDYAKEKFGSLYGV
jgi:carboxypeptidase Taq